MQSSFTQEQEDQLTRWGCPHALPAYPVAPRQPHGVLAWINTLDENQWYGLAGPGLPPECECYALIIADGLETVNYADGPHPDPYAATFALAQAVMEAKNA